MAPSALDRWEATRDALHQIALITGAIRVACSDPLSNDLHFSLDVTADGLSTTEMKCGGLLEFSFKNMQLSLARGGSRVFSLDVAGHSQISLMRRLLELLDDSGCSVQPSMKHISFETAFAFTRAQALSEPYTGLYAPYDALRVAKPFAAAVETMLMSYHRNAAGQLRQ